MVEVEDFGGLDHNGLMKYLSADNLEIPRGFRDHGPNLRLVFVLPK